MIDLTEFLEQKLIFILINNINILYIVRVLYLIVTNQKFQQNKSIQIQQILYIINCNIESFQIYFIRKRGNNNSKYYRIIPYNINTLFI